MKNAMRIMRIICTVLAVFSLIGCASEEKKQIGGQIKLSEQTSKESANIAMIEAYGKTVENKQVAFFDDNDCYHVIMIDGDKVLCHIMLMECTDERMYNSQKKQITTTDSNDELLLLEVTYKPDNMGKTNLAMYEDLHKGDLYNGILSMYNDIIR